MSLESPIHAEILGYLGLLKLEEQLRVAELARSLVTTANRGTPGKEMLRLEGKIPHDDLEEMKRAIEDECENTDANEW
jgi:hypothetical protein